MSRREADLDLSSAREEALLAGEHVPAIFTTDPDSGRIGDWWDAHSSVAEWAGEGAAFPKMPGDWTTNHTPRRADSGLRRTHRIRYSSNGFSLRMPSAASIHRFAAINRGAFDIPVEATNAEGRTVTAWVRTVQHQPGSWSVSGLGFGGVTDAQVSEGVASVLEARRPSFALRRAGDLIEKHRQRVADEGTRLRGLRSGWISAVGYSDTDGLLVMRTRATTDTHGNPVPAKAYGSMVSRETFEELKTSDRPGTIYNLMVKGSPGQMVRTCPTCSRVFPAARAHTCPAAVGLAMHNPGVVEQDQQAGRRVAVRGIHRRRRRTRPPAGPASPNDTASGERPSVEDLDRHEGRDAGDEV